MDDQDLTPWQEINPAAVVTSAPPSLSSASLEPATRDDFRDQLTACLALVAPSGMSDGERRDWLLSAWDALRDIPADLLERGCRAARLSADHPAKIVPAIMAEVEDNLKWRRESARSAAEYRALPAPTRRTIGQLMDHRRGPMTAEETSDLNAHLAHLGATARYRPDGSKYHVESVS